MPIAPKPLYRDPIHDGAADPVVIWNPHRRRWWMFYTNRRANQPALANIEWVHGTHIGIAESDDAGATWSHVGEADIPLPAEFDGPGGATHWAPDIVTHEGLHHMYLSVVPGCFDTWNHPRSIVHLTSTDLRTWSFVSRLSLCSDRVIDACVLRLPSGGWRMWYNDEKADKGIAFADSVNLFDWVDRGAVILPGRAAGEGPKVFPFHDRHWMIVDEWRGQAVYHSFNCADWSRQEGPLLLSKPGRGSDDAAFGHHADVVVSGDRAWMFYFCHPDRPIGEMPAADADVRRSSVQVVELFVREGRLECDRDLPTDVHLTPP